MKILDFEDYQIKDSIIIFNKSGATASKFGCIGKMSAKSESVKIVKKCEGKVVKEKERATQVNITISSHLVPEINRKLMGLSNTDLKPGVYSYGENSFCEPFTLTARVEDMEGKIRYIAFPNISNATGLTLNVDNDQTEIALKDLELTALIDEHNQFYYEAFEDELEDNDTKTKWLTDFNYDLVKLNAPA